MVEDPSGPHDQCLPLKEDGWRSNSWVANGVYTRSVAGT